MLLGQVSGKTAGIENLSEEEYIVISLTPANMSDIPFTVCLVFFDTFPVA